MSLGQVTHLLWWESRRFFLRPGAFEAFCKEYYYYLGKKGAKEAEGEPIVTTVTQPEVSTKLSIRTSDVIAGGRVLNQWNVGASRRDTLCPNVSLCGIISNPAAHT